MMNNAMNLIRKRIESLEQQAPKELDISALTAEERAELVEIMNRNGATYNTKPDYKNMSTEDLKRMKRILDKVKEKT